MASAEQMLHEIQSESLQKLLTQVQQRTRPCGLTGIPSLDTYLSTRSLSESQISISRPPGNAIRIQGPPGSGKTHLLYYLVATSVMPINHLSCFIGGWNKVAFVMDLDGHFQISRFHEILVNRLQRSVEAASITSIAERCMQSVHIFRPSSSAQLAVTLTHLPKYHSKYFPCQELGMVAIHSIDAFHWLDRFKAEQLRPNLSTATAHSDNISSILEELRTSYGLTTISTLWGLPRQMPDTNTNRDIRPQLFGAAHREEFPVAFDSTAATLVLSGVARHEDYSRFLTKFQWHAQAFDHPQPSLFSCEVNQNGIIVE